MPTTNDAVTLQCPRADGSGASFQVYTLAQFDDQRQPVTAQLQVAVNSQPSLMQVTVGTYTPSTQVFTPDANGKDVQIKTIAVRPVNISTATVRIRDGRLDGGSPVEFVVNVTLVSPPGVPPTIELVTKHPLVTLP